MNLFWFWSGWWHHGLRCASQRQWDAAVLCRMQLTQQEQQILLKDNSWYGVDEEGTAIFPYLHFIPLLIPLAWEVCTEYFFLTTASFSLLQEELWWILHIGCFKISIIKALLSSLEKCWHYYYHVHDMPLDSCKKKALRLEKCLFFVPQKATQL